MARPTAPQLSKSRTILILASMSTTTNEPNKPTVPPPAEPPAAPASGMPKRPREIGGPKGPEPTRYGDWEVGGRCTDF
jgi:hypothetical protein